MDQAINTPLIIEQERDKQSSLRITSDNLLDTHRKVEVVMATERDELIRLRRENKQPRQERDILSRAAAWFARETGAVSSGSPFCCSQAM
jgi:transposase-like protein